MYLVWFLFFFIACSSDSIENLKKLGTDEFSQDAWRNATQEERGAMVYSFLSNYDISKMMTHDLISLLGQSTAYYEYDEFPAYFIGPQTVESEYGKGYVLAFPINRKTGLISSFVIIPKP